MRAFDDFSGLIALRERNVVPYDSVLDNMLLGRDFSAAGAHSDSVARDRSSHRLLWSGQWPPQLHMILAQILRYQN